VITVKRILITGGRGGIGRSLTEALVSSSENQVITLGRRTPSPSTCSRVIHYEGSILDTGLLIELLLNHKITHLIHAAGARTSEFALDPLTGFEANVLGTDQVFRAALQCPTLEQLIHFSTAAVYGGHQTCPDESAPLAPATPYAISKAASEMAVQGHAGSALFSTVILRPGFVLGPYSHSALSTFITNAITEEKAALSFPDRFFLHWAPDLAAAVCALLNNELSGSFEVLHPPGKATSLSALHDVLIDYCRGQEHSPAISLSAIEDTPFPERLNPSKFTDLVGASHSTEWGEILERLSTS